MTEKWVVPKLFEGKTVAVIAAAPGVTRELVDSVVHLPRIAVRRACFLAPDADMMVALDGPDGPFDGGFWAEAALFPGLKICGVECDLDACYLQLPHERVVLGVNHEIEIRNNGLAAIRIAAQAGAAKILLLGFDTEAYEAQHSFTGLTVGLAALVKELAAQGVAVERVEQVQRKREQ